MSENKREILVKNLVGFLIIIIIVFCVFVFNMKIGFSVFESFDARIPFILLNTLLFIIIVILIIFLVIYKIKKLKKEEINNG